MAGFKTHITTSTILGIGYGAVAYAKFGVPWDTAALAGGLCSVSGMLPDIDSGPGRPLRESLSVAAAVVPMLMIDRFTKLGMNFEQMALAGGAIYCLIRFGFAWFLRRYTVHRGMFHSIPACLIFGELAFLVCHSDNLYLRYFKAGGVVLGFMSHLILDEIWSIEFSHGIPHLKSSSGTAIKFWGTSMWANFSCYAKLAVLTFLVLQDPIWMGRFDTKIGDQVENIADGVLQKLQR